MATDDLIVSVNANSISEGNKASVYWNTNIEANCGIDYGIGQNSTDMIGTNGNLIQVGLPTNDGKFHYVVNLINLQADTDYYYRVNCNYGSNNLSYRGEVKKLAKYKGIKYVYIHVACVDEHFRVDYNYIFHFVS